MGNYILYSHAGSKNHGCEALLRTTCSVIQDVDKVYSGDVEADRLYGATEIVPIYPEKSEGYSSSVGELLYRAKYKLFRDDRIFYKNLYRGFIKNIEPDKIYISIGGDNYCYHYSTWLEVLNSAVNRKKGKTVLWGCSVDEDALSDKGVLDDLKNYTLITTRESISYEVLKKYLPTSNIHFVPDTAFLLPKVDLPLPEGFQEGNTVGLNVSPVAVKNAKDGDKLLSYMVEFVNYIISNTTYQIALIPHVVFEGNDDRETLQAIQQKCSAPSRTVLIQDCNCMELKGYISRCKMFVGARTHATIAAYSTCVPTVVLGYSVKSRGIARDLFGSEQRYVLPVQSLTSAQELIDSFCWLEENESQIHEALKSKLNDYRDKIYNGVSYLEQL